MDKLHRNVQECFARPPEKRETTGTDDGAVSVKSADAVPDTLSSRPSSGSLQQNIVYAASIRQVNLQVVLAVRTTFEQSLSFLRAGQVTLERERS